MKKCKCCKRELNKSDFHNVPMPKITHHYVGGRNIEEHRKHNALWLKKLFYFDVEKILFDGFDGHDRIHAKC